MHQSRWLQELYLRLRPWRWPIALALLLTLFNAGVSLLPDSDTILLIGFSMVIFIAQISQSLLAQYRQFMLSAVVLKLTRNNLRLDVFRRRYVTDNLFRTLPRVMDAFAPAVVFTIGGWKVFTGDLTVGNLVTITGFLPALNAPIRSFSETFLALKDISGRMERVVEYLDLPVELGLEPGLRVIESIQGKVEFQAVSYQVGDKVILDKVSVCVQPGEYVALVGFSGAGKSTVLKLLARMIEPTAGQIELDGVPLTALEATSLRRRLGIVAQNTFLFNDTLWNNLCYLGDATEADVQAVVESVGADVFIQELSDGTHTQLGERGMTLSGGQRQRIGIARALLGRYDLLLLDEVTSALDRQSERQVLGAIRAAMPSKTRLVVAHRLDTVLDADRILVFDQGKLVEAGTHASLLVQDGLYKQLWEASNQSEEGERCAVEVNI